MPKRQPEHSNAPEALTYSDLQAAQALITQLDPLGDDSRSPFPNLRWSDPAAYESYIPARVAVDHLVGTFDPVRREIAMAEQSLRDSDEPTRRGFLRGILPAPPREKPDPLTSGNAQLLVKVLRGARSDPRFDQKTREGIATALPVLIDLQNNLSTLESAQSMLSAQQVEVALRRRSFRRRSLLIGGLTLGGLTLAGGFGDLIYNLGLSPEAQRQQQLDELQYERAHALTTSPSDTTTNGWTVQLAPEKEGTTYSRSQHPQDTFNIESDSTIDLGANDTFNWGSKATAIHLASFTFVNGEESLKLTLDLPNDVTEEKLIPVPHGGNMSDTIIQLTNVRTGANVYVQFRPESPDSIGKYTMVVMIKRVTPTPEARPSVAST